MVISLLLLFPIGVWADDAFSFIIDAQHVYPGMDMNYAQGYVPAVENNTARVVLPLILKGNGSCDNIMVRIDLGESCEAPFICKNYINTFAPQRYEFSGGRVTCFLVRFDIELKADRVNGSYPILANVEGLSKGGEKIERQFPLYIIIRDGTDSADTGESASQPRLMMESYAYGPRPLQAGGDGTLTATVKNMSRTQSVQNIKLTIQDDGAGILPAETGSVYVPEIGKGESISCDFALRVTEKAAVGPHAVAVTMEYEDESASVLTAADTVVLDIEQPLRLEYEQPSLPGKVTEGDNLSFSMELMNLGKSTVYNVLVKFEIPGMNNGGSILVGNIEPGKSAPAKTNLLVNAMDERYGETAGEIILSYENEAGEVFTREMDVHTVIEEKIDVGPAAEEENHPKKAVPWWGIVIAAIILLGVIGIISAKTIKAQKKRKADELRL